MPVTSGNHPLSPEPSIDRLLTHLASLESRLAELNAHLRERRFSHGHDGVTVTVDGHGAVLAIDIESGLPAQLGARRFGEAVCHAVGTARAENSARVNLLARDWLPSGLALDELADGVLTGADSADSTAGWLS